MVITKEGLSINGRVLEITLDYILLDAQPYNSPVKLAGYYVRPFGPYRKVEVEYIQAAVVNTKKKVGMHAAAGGLSGAIMGANATENSDATLSETAGAAAAGLVLGGLVGTIKGTARKKGSDSHLRTA